MVFSPASLLSIVRAHLPAAASGRLCVAFSGGLDSTVLLAGLSQALRSEPGYQLCAIHVDHGLHADSARWARHCADVAERLGIEHVSQTVTVPATSEGVEAAARRVRYAALRERLQPGDALLTAHHADDQFETLLLALLRGAGLAGLSAMPVCRTFAPGFHLRPLLGFTRTALEEWARTLQLTWVSDPANNNSRFDRNFLRHEVLPLLRSRWPAATQNALRSANHLSEGTTLLDELAEADYAVAAIGPCLRVTALAALSAARRRNLLRYWARRCGARPPSMRKLLALEHDMLAAQEDRVPMTEWDGFEVRRFRGLLYGERTRTWSGQAVTAFDWDWSQPILLPDELGSLSAQNGLGAGLCRKLLPRTLRVEFRRGGELLRPAGQLHRRSLKKLLQDADILPWWRSHLPLLWIDDRLAAVGDLWTADEFSAGADAESVRVLWQDKPQIRAQATAAS